MSGHLSLPWPPEPDDLRTLHEAVSMAITLYDAVEAESGVPTSAPLYGKRDRLVELARQLDHQANCSGRLQELAAISERRPLTYAEIVEARDLAVEIAAEDTADEIEAWLKSAGGDTQ